MSNSLYLLLTFVISLVIVIICGRILNEINLSGSSCKTDSRIASAHRWAAWSVGIFSTVAGISLIAFILTFYFESTKSVEKITVAE
jgi:hypothetical protein